MSAAHTLELLQAFLAPAGVSGSEQDMAALVRAAWQGLADEVVISPLGSVHALLRGTSPGNRPKLIACAHLDSVGLIVTGFVGAFLRLGPAGGFDPRVLQGQPVHVLGRRPLSGVLLAPPDAQPSSEPTPITGLIVDCGLDEAALQDRVRLGDAVAFAQPPIRLGDSWLVSPRLDNRVSLVALTQCLEALAQERPAWDFVAAAVVREETDDAGSTTSAYALAPQAAVVLDTTFGRTPDLPEHASFALGAGLSNAWGPAVHPAMFRLLEQAAADCGVSLTPEFLPNLTQTDADHIQLVLAGVPTAVISIPILNMHTPVEIVDLGDIEQAARLLTVFARELGHNLHLELTHD